MPPRELVGQPTRDVNDGVIGVLGRYVSTPTAQSVLALARKRTGIQSPRLSAAQLTEMLDSLERSVGFFLADGRHAKDCRRALEALASTGGSPTASPAEVRAVEVSIRVEDDIARARFEARQLAVDLGFSVVGQTRLMTAVSELSRNIVQYAGEGRMNLVPSASPRGVEIVATDHGPGILNLSQILTGNYRSRLGMGLGLRGVKQIAERFDVRTEPGGGTTVTALLRRS